MRVRVGRLREALSLLEMVAPKKPSMPELANAVIRDGRIEATDLEIAVALEFPEADGDYMVPLRPVLTTLRRIPEMETITVQQEGRRLGISWDSGKSAFNSVDPGDFPPIKPVTPVAQGWIDGDTLVAEMESLVGYCKTEADRPVLTGVYLKLGEALEVAAADGFRLAYRELPLSFPAEGMEGIIVPSRAVSILAAILRKLPRQAGGDDDLVQAITARRKLYLNLSQEQLEVKAYPMTFTCQLIGGTFPDYHQLVPQDAPFRVRLMATDLRMAVRQAADIARDGAGIVRLVWDEERMTVSAKADGIGEIESSVPVEVEGGPARVAINAGYLLDYLRDKEGQLTMNLKASSAPVRFNSGSGPLVLLMPMFVQWGDTPAPGSEKPEQGDGAGVETPPEDKAEAAGEAEHPEDEVRAVEAEKKPKRRRSKARA